MIDVLTSVYASECYAVTVLLIHFDPVNSVRTYVNSNRITAIKPWAMGGMEPPEIKVMKGGKRRRADGEKEQR